MSNSASWVAILAPIEAENRRRIRNNTWGHMAPEKNVSYPGLVRFCMTDHSAYGCQPIILQYEFPNLEGPYIHDALFDYIVDWDTDGFDVGAIYQVELTFRNYRWYSQKPKLIASPMSPIVREVTP